MSKKRDEFEKRPNDELLDPEPISTAAIVIAGISAMATITQLLSIVRDERIKNKAKSRKYRAIVRRSRIMAEQIVEDVEFFQKIWRPEIVETHNDVYSMWNLSYYDYRSRKQMLARIINAYQKLEDLQNQLGELELDEMGDNWRMHSIAAAQELFKKLSSISNLDDFKELSRDIRHRSINYLEVLTAIENDLENKLQ